MGADDRKVFKTLLEDPISRMEALAIAKADQQCAEKLRRHHLKYSVLILLNTARADPCHARYLVPTSGKPLRGLIQADMNAASCWGLRTAEGLLPSRRHVVLLCHYWT